jgi:hypothetical protein
MPLLFGRCSTLRAPSWFVALAHRAPLAPAPSAAWLVAGGTALIGNQAFVPTTNAYAWLWLVWWTTLVAGAFLFLRGVVGVVGFAVEQGWVVGATVRDRGLPRVRVEWGPGGTVSQHAVDEDLEQLIDDIDRALPDFIHVATWHQDSHRRVQKYDDLIGRFQKFFRRHGLDHQPEVNAAITARGPVSGHESGAYRQRLENARGLSHEVLAELRGTKCLHRKESRTDKVKPTAPWPPALRSVPAAFRTVRVKEYRDSRNNVATLGGNLRTRLWSQSRYQLENKKASFDSQMEGFLKAVEDHKQDWWSQGEPGEFDLEAKVKPIDPTAQVPWQAEMSARIEAELEWLREHHEPGQPE